MSKFKVGDKVKCVMIAGNSYSIKDYGHGWVLGLEFKIEYMTFNDEVCWGAKNGYGVYANALELVERKIKVYGIVKFLESIERK